MSAVIPDRCEWIYIDGNRCRNTLSLKKHHRSYDRFGHENESDFSILCPVHHLIADIERKNHLGIRRDMMIEWFNHVIDCKRRNIPPQRFEKFYTRLAHEADEFDHEASLGASAIIEVAEIMSHAVENDSGLIEIECDESMIDTIKMACWYVLIKNLCIEDENIKRTSRWAFRTMLEINQR